MFDSTPHDRGQQLNPNEKVDFYTFEPERKWLAPKVFKTLSICGLTLYCISPIKFTSFFNQHSTDYDAYVRSDATKTISRSAALFQVSCQSNLLWATIDLLQNHFTLATIKWLIFERCAECEFNLNLVTVKSHYLTLCSVKRRPEQSI